MNSSVVAFFMTILAFTTAVPLVLHEVEGQQYEITSVLGRQRRDDPPKFSLGGAANSKSQNLNFGVHNPNGSGGQLGYGHSNGYGHDVSLDVMVPVWSKKRRHGESTLNLGGGVSQHFGGYSGTHLTDKRVGLNFIHRF